MDLDNLLVVFLIFLLVEEELIKDEEEEIMEDNGEEELVAKTCEEDEIAVLVTFGIGVLVEVGFDEEVTFGADVVVGSFDVDVDVDVGIEMVEITVEVNSDEVVGVIYLLLEVVVVGAM